MGHDDRADVLEISQLDHLVVDGGRGDRIETCRRLVVQQDARLECHGPRDRDAPPLPTREFGRHLVDVLGEPDEAEHFFDAAVDFLQRHVGFLVQLVADVFANGERVEERALLEDHPQIRADGHQLVLAELIDALAVDPHHAGVRLQQSHDDLERRRFSRPAGPQDDLRVPLDEREAEIPQDDLVVEGELHAVEHHDRRAHFSEHLFRRETVGRRLHVSGDRS